MPIYTAWIISNATMLLHEILRRTIELRVGRGQLGHDGIDTILAEGDALSKGVFVGKFLRHEFSAEH